MKTRSQTRGAKQGAAPVARELALEAAIEAAAKCAPAVEILADKFRACDQKHPVDLRERALATEILLGTLRRRGSIDLVLSAVGRRTLDSLDAPVREALRQGAYQLLYLERVPDHAAVNEAVRLVTKHVGKSAAGYANACLRATARLVERRVEAEIPDGLARRALAAKDGKTLILRRDLLPDPAGWPAAHLAARHSMPEWIVQRWLDRSGRVETEGLLEWANATPPLTVRLSARADGMEPETAFAGAASFEPAGLEDAWHVDAPVESLPGLRAGLFAVQDLTSQRPARMLAPPRGGRVLDLCAAPGGKSVQLAVLVGPGGEVTAVDVSARRLEKVREAAGRLGIENIRTVEADGTNLPTAAGERFDAALVDVPCSNLGVLGRRPEVRWRLKAETFGELARTQLALLRGAAARVRPGGAVVYSTCSLAEEENGDVIAAFLAQAGDFALDLSCTYWPRAGRCDGGFAARMKKVES